MMSGIYYDADWEEVSRWEEERSRRDNKILRKLKRSTASKYYNAILAEFEHHMFYCDFSIVDKSECKGEKIRGDYYIGESTPIRHVYNDVRGCSYDGDSYSGFIFIKIDKRRYFKMFVNG